MKKILLAVAVLFAAVAVHAQSEGSTYRTALGLKVYPGAVTIKHFIQNNRALEGLGYFNSDGFRLTGLYEVHGDFNGAPGLKWYIGGGGHVGFWSDTWKQSYPYRNGGTAIGVDGVLGLDYKITGAPINLSFDWQPSFNFIGYNYFEGGWGGLAVRYTF